MAQSTYLIAGGTGFVGKHLIKALPVGSQVILLSRNPQQATAVFKQLETHAELLDSHFWHPAESLPPAAAFEQANTLINLAGESVAKGRWTKAKRQRIYNSRILGTRHLVEALNQYDHQLTTFVSTSAVGFYGFCGEQILDEASPAGTDFLATVVQQWESELQALQTDVRQLVPRFGVVLGPDGGAFPQMVMPFRLFAGGRIASGNQWVPWIHIRDCIDAILNLMQNQDCEGVYNLTAPQPCTNLHLTKAIGTALHRPTCLPMPAPLLYLAIGQFAQVLINSQLVVPHKLVHETPFEFSFGDIQSAIADILSKGATV